MEGLLNSTPLSNKGNLVSPPISKVLSSKPNPPPSEADKTLIQLIHHTGTGNNTVLFASL